MKALLILPFLLLTSFNLLADTYDRQDEIATAFKDNECSIIQDATMRQVISDIANNYTTVYNLPDSNPCSPRNVDPQVNNTIVRNLCKMMGDFSKSYNFCEDKVWYTKNDRNQARHLSTDALDIGTYLTGDQIVEYMPWLVQETQLSPDELATRVQEKITANPGMSYDDAAAAVQDEVALEDQNQAATTVTVVMNMVSIIDRMHASGCFEQIGENFSSNTAYAISDILYGISNLSTAAIPLDPLFADIAIGARLAMMLTGVVGNAIDVIEEMTSALDPMAFTSRVCGLNKLIAAQAKARCLAGCEPQLDALEKELKREQAEAQAAACFSIQTPLYNDLQSIEKAYTNYANLLKQIENFQLTTSNVLPTDELRMQREAFINTVEQDQNYMAKHLGFENGLAYANKYLDPENASIKSSWKDFTPPSLTDLEKKHEVNMLLGVPGMVFQNEICSKNISKEEYATNIQHKFPRQYLQISYDEIKPACQKIALYRRCSQGDGFWTTDPECKAENTKVYNAGRPYSIFDELDSPGLKVLMSAVQAQKLNTEINSNNTTCIDRESCIKDKYNCLAILDQMDGATNCNVLAHGTAVERDVNYMDWMNSLIGSDYFTFHGKIVQEEKDEITGTTQYSTEAAARRVEAKRVAVEQLRKNNIAAAVHEIDFMQTLIQAENEYNECMAKANANHNECLAAHTAMTDAATRYVEQCALVTTSGVEEVPTVTQGVSAWQDVFRASTGGNFNVTINSLLNRKRDPWARAKAEARRLKADLHRADPTKPGPESVPEDLTAKEIESLSLAVCETLYCAAQELDDQDPLMDHNAFMRFWISIGQSIFKGSRPGPLLYESRKIREEIRKECPDIIKKKIRTQFSSNVIGASSTYAGGVTSQPGETFKDRLTEARWNQYAQCHHLRCGGKEGIAAQFAARFPGGANEYLKNLGLAVQDCAEGRVEQNTGEQTKAATDSE